MKYLISISILFLFASNCYSQTLLDDSDKSSKHVLYIFKTPSGKQVVTHSLIARSSDIDSIKLLTKKDFDLKFKDNKAASGMYVFFKPKTTMLELEPLLQLYKIAIDPSQFLIKIDNDKPVHKKNLYAIVQSIKAIDVDKEKKIIHISLLPDQHK
jgi:hypothetical protein